MITYAEIMLAVLEFINKMVDYGQQQKWINEGQSLAIAKSAAEILRKSNYAKQALSEFSSKPDGDVNDFLRSLEPGEPDSK